MRELNGRQVYTRSDLQEKTKLSISALEKLFRDRVTNGHPDSSGKEGRSLVWDAEEWDKWFEARQQAMNPDESTLIDFEGIAKEYGVDELRAKQLWDEREANDHPEPVNWQGRRPRWDRETYAQWWNEAGQTLAQLLSESRGGNPNDLITLSEAARVMGVVPTSITNYPRRPPVGWPEPVEEEETDGGQIRRKYRRGDIWDYMDGRQPNPGGHKPVGAKRRAYPYQGDPRLQQARDALAATPEARRSELPRKLAEEHGGTPGTWSHILTTARHIAAENED